VYTMPSKYAFNSNMLNAMQSRDPKYTYIQHFQLTFAVTAAA
jgi:hypothetical protein